MPSIDYYECFDLTAEEKEMGYSVKYWDSRYKAICKSNFYKEEFELVFDEKYIQIVEEILEDSGIEFRIDRNIIKAF